jgi:hypothetical protein
MEPHEPNRSNGRNNEEECMLEKNDDEGHELRRSSMEGFARMN